MLDCYLAVKDKIIFKGLNFELLGFDFMLDDDFGVWLLEVILNISYKILINLSYYLTLGE